MARKETSIILQISNLIPKDKRIDFFSNYIGNESSIGARYHTIVQLLEKVSLRRDSMIVARVRDRSDEHLPTYINISDLIYMRRVAT